MMGRRWASIFLWRAEAPRSAGGARQRPGRKWLGHGQSAHAGDKICERLRNRRGANTGTPKAGVFAEGAAKAVATALIAKIKNAGNAVEYNGFGTCYIEFGGGRIGKVEVDFFSGPKPTGDYYEPTGALRAEKDQFGSSRRARWFGL
jgi:hypothetical protein